jgi:hypothetical protein
MDISKSFKVKYGINVVMKYTVSIWFKNKIIQEDKKITPLLRITHISRKNHCKFKITLTTL